MFLCLAVGCGDIVTEGADASGSNDATGTDVDAQGGSFDADPAAPDGAPPIDAEPPDADPNACIGEGTPCGPVTECDNFGPCGGFSGTCDEIGTQSRTCVDFICVAGQCTAGSPYTDSTSCTRNTDNTPCGQDTACGSCQFDDQCDESGTRSCTTTSFECSNGSCEVSGTSGSTQSCTRNTDGDFCGATAAGCPIGKIRDLCCTSTGSCTQACGTCQ